MTDREVMQMALDAITDWGVSRRKVAETVAALRTALAKPDKEWVGLTDKEIEDCLEMSIQGTCRAIEAKLKEKNNG